ncbi:S-4TM family putative pore-forming effector [Faecalispora jeddahensis]|uniref:S-4TM family putative pore-forming effector n=1 Tax=Faecalispora jeddahensis TaxID=1414721 RepID=UPI00189B77F9|nr:S-4TM family putative pore-forming effector [Faecalispora jeddahensis]
MSNDEIQSRQNDEKLLKIQYAAREYYNSAERLNHYAWLLCLASAFSVFSPDSWPVLITYGVPFTADIVAICFMSGVDHKVKTAAKLRKYFDAYVLNICPNQFSENYLREIKEVAGKIYSKNPQRAKIQMTNTEKDSPPGVFSWYVFSKPYTGISAQFECQRQNTWWNSKVFHKRFIVTVCAAILVSFTFCFFMLNSDVLRTIFCSAGLIGKIVERLIENKRYINLSIQIDGAQQTVEAHPTKEGIEFLQSLIDKRRSVNVLELNLVHKKLANLLSKEYEDCVL